MKKILRIFFLIVVIFFICFLVVIFTQPDDKIVLEDVPLYVQDLQIVEELEKKLSSGVNVIFLLQEYETVTQIDVELVSGILFDYKKNLFLKRKRVNEYYLKTAYLQQIFYEKTNEDLLNSSEDKVICVTPDGDNWTTYVKIISMTNEGDYVEISYELHDGAEVCFWKGLVKMKKKDNKLLFVSNKRIAKK